MYRACRLCPGRLCRQGGLSRPPRESDCRLVGRGTARGPGARQGASRWWCSRLVLLGGVAGWRLAAWCTCEHASATQSVSWCICEHASATQSVSWCTCGNASATQSVSWCTCEHASATQSVSWCTCGNASATQSVSWCTCGHASATQSVSWCTCGNASATQSLVCSIATAGCSQLLNQSGLQAARCRSPVRQTNSHRGADK